MDKAAVQSQQSAEIMRRASQTDAIPSIPYSNAAQQGGATMVTAVEIATGVAGAGKWAIRNAPELLAKRSDDVAKAAETLLDRGRRILGDMPLNSKSLDDLYQAGKLSMDEARALAKSANWKDKDGWSIYPPNDGFSSAPKAVVLKKGDQLLIDRYGKPTGSFASPLGEGKSARALPKNTDFSDANYHVYKVVGDIPARVGRATPWFDEVGGAIQYKLDSKIEKLLDSEKLIELRR